MENDSCKGIWGEFFGHKFEPVFETEVTSNPDPAIVQTMMAPMQDRYCSIDAGCDANPFAELLHEMRGSKNIYIHHICTRCGKTVKR
jgi:hypothetical protein